MTPESDHSLSRGRVLCPAGCRVAPLASSERCPLPGLTRKNVPRHCPMALRGKQLAAEITALNNINMSRGVTENVLPLGEILSFQRKTDETLLFPQILNLKIARENPHNLNNWNYGTHCQVTSVKMPSFLFFFFITVFCFNLRERGVERMSGEERQRETDRESQAVSVLSPTRGSIPQPWDRDLS